MREYSGVHTLAERDPSHLSVGSRLVEYRTNRIIRAAQRRGMTLAGAEVADVEFRVSIIVRASDYLSRRSFRGRTFYREPGRIWQFDAWDGRRIMCGGAWRATVYCA